MESIKNKYTISFDSWCTKREIVKDRLEFQVDIGSAQNIDSLKYLVITHQSADIINAQNKANNLAILDNLDVRKYFFEIDGQRYPNDAISTNYAEKE